VARLPLPVSGRIDVAGYGALNLRISSLSYGLEIIATQSQSRANAAFYPRANTQDSFGLGITCLTYAEWVRLCEFTQGYGTKVHQGLVSTARVRVPAHNFDRTGIPNGIAFGDDVRKSTWRTTMNFLGARDLVPVNSRDVTKVSNVIGAEAAAAIKKDAAVAYFYPTGNQLTGSTYGADRLYDTPVRAPLAQEPRIGVNDRRIDPRQLI